MAKVSFDGENKIIQVVEGVTSLNVKEDIYSEWKEWVLTDDNAKYLPAMSSIGGDPIRSGVYLGSTFFLENGWKLKPWSGTYELIVDGNIYTRDGVACFIPADGTCNITITMTKSNIIDTISTSGSEGASAEEVATAVWNKNASTVVSSNTMGTLVKQTQSNTEDNIALTIAGLNS